MNSFRKFEKETKSCHSWPLELGLIRAFTTFSLSSGRLSPSTVSSYLAGLSYLHIIRGFSVPSFLQDEHIKLILRGAKNINSPTSWANRRRHVSIPILWILHEEIHKSPWSGYLKTSLWALFCLAFFASARMEELESTSRTSYDPNSTLRIRDVLDRGSNILRQPQTTKIRTNWRRISSPFPFSPPQSMSSPSSKTATKSVQGKTARGTPATLQR